MLSGEQIGQLMDRIREQFAMAQDAEITMEVNPGTANAEKLRNFTRQESTVSVSVCSLPRQKN